MEKKIALVTGGTSGIGLSIVKALVKEEYEVHFIGRNATAGARIEEELPTAFFHAVDLENLKDVRVFLLGFKKNYSKLDLLANIAGTVLPKRQETREGIEKNFALSYLSPFYMSNELLPLLKKGELSRIVNVGASPSVVLEEKLNFSDLNSVVQYNGFKASALAVHAKTVLTQILSERFSDSSITVNSFHPGNIRSGLLRNASAPVRVMMKLCSPFFKKECKTGIRACLHKQWSDTTGSLITEKKVISLSFGQEYRQRLWKESEKLIEQALSSEEV